MEHTHKVIAEWLNVFGEVTSESELARFVSEQWANTFAKSAEAWTSEMGGDGLVRITVKVIEKELA